MNMITLTATIESPPYTSGDFTVLNCKSYRNEKKQFFDWYQVLTSRGQEEFITGDNIIICGVLEPNVLISRTGKPHCQLIVIARTIEKANANDIIF